MCGEFPLTEQVRLVLTDVLRTELVGRALEVTREIFDGLEVDVGCSLGVITTLEFLEHDFAKVGHRSSPYAPTLSLHLVYSTAADTEHAKASAAKRLRSNRHMGDYSREVGQHPLAARQLDVKRPMRGCGSWVPSGSSATLPRSPR